MDKTDLVWQMANEDNQKGYALPYHTEGRQIVKVGLHFDLDSRTLDEWVVA